MNDEISLDGSMGAIQLLPRSLHPDPLKVLDEEHIHEITGFTKKEKQA